MEPGEEGRMVVKEVSGVGCHFILFFGSSSSLLESSCDQLLSWLRAAIRMSISGSVTCAYSFALVISADGAGGGVYPALL